MSLNSDVCTFNVHNVYKVDSCYTQHKEHNRLMKHFNISSIAHSKHDEVTSAKLDDT